MALSLSLVLRLKLERQLAKPLAIHRQRLGIDGSTASSRTDQAQPYAIASARSGGIRQLFGDIRQLF